MHGKVAIITGGAGGIGAATAKVFVREGASVVLADLNAEALEKTLGEIGSDRVSYVVTDVTKEDDARELVAETLRRHGKLDVFFANAGIEGRINQMMDQTAEDFDKVIAVNLRGVFLSLKYSLAALKDGGGGSIIVTSSVAGVVGFPGLSPPRARRRSPGLPPDPALPHPDPGLPPRAAGAGTRR